MQTPTLTSAQTYTVENALTSQLHAKNMSTSFVGASWGSQITTKAIQALITFLIEAKRQNGPFLVLVPLS